MRLVASDYDFTLAPLPSSLIHPRTKDALVRVMELGIPLVITSGRGTSGLANRLAHNGLDTSGLYLCGYGGAEMCDLDGRVISSHHLSGGLARRACEIACEFPVEVIAHRGADAYTFSPIREVDDSQPWRDGVSTHSASLDGVEELEPSKILTVGHQDDLLKVADALASELGGDAEVILSAEGLMEINAPGVTKGRALAELAGLLDIPLSETIAFGDNHNDISLLQTAGVGVAVANAVPELLAVADRIAPPCEQGGVGAILEEVFPHSPSGF